MKRIWILLCCAAMLTTGCGKKQNTEQKEQLEYPEHVETVPTAALEPTASQTENVTTETTAFTESDSVPQETTIPTIPFSGLRAPETIPYEERTNPQKYQYASAEAFQCYEREDADRNKSVTWGNSISAIGDGNYLFTYPDPDSDRLIARLMNLQLGELAKLTVDFEPTLTETGFWTLKTAENDTEPAMVYNERRYTKFLLYRYSCQLESSFDLSPLGNVRYLYCDAANRVLYGLSDTEDGFVIQELPFFAKKAEIVVDARRVDTSIYSVQSLHYTSWGFLFTGFAAGENDLPVAAYGTITLDGKVTILGTHDSLEGYQLAPFWEGAYIYGEQCETGQVLRLYGGRVETVTLSEKPTTRVFSASPSGAYLLAGDVEIVEEERLRDPRRESTRHLVWMKYLWMLAYDANGTLIGKCASHGAEYDSLAEAEADTIFDGMSFRFFYDEQRAEAFFTAAAAHPGYAPVMGTMTAMDMRKIEKTPFGQDEYLEEGRVR